VFVYVQSRIDKILKEADGLVYNMALHNEEWLMTIKKYKKPFLLVHGGFQGKMAKIEDIIDFARKHRPRLIIAPDIYRDQVTTLILTEEYVNRCPDLIEISAGVIQGGLGDFYDVIEIYDKWGFKWVAIPSDNHKILGLIDFLREHGWKIHILGGRLNTLYEVDSIDLVIGLNNIALFEVLRWKRRGIHIR